jgi:phosphoribosylglycinamide formyltransferase-1
MRHWYNKKKVVSFLVSGSGLNFRAVAKRIIKKEIKAKIGVVVTDNSTAGVLDKAKELGIAAYFVDPGSHTTKEEYDEAIIHIFKRCETDLIVTAGYMRLVTPYFVNQYRNRIINIHPSLLPSFPGVHGPEKAIESGVKITGCTSHFVDEGMDSGPIIMQSPISVLDDDTVQSLSARILKEEFRVLSESIRLFCEGRLHLVDNKVMKR